MTNGTTVGLFVTATIVGVAVFIAAPLTSPSPTVLTPFAAGDSTAAGGATPAASSAPAAAPAAQTPAIPVPAAQAPAAPEPPVPAAQAPGGQTRAAGGPNAGPNAGASAGGEPSATDPDVPISARTAQNGAGGGHR